MLIGSRLKSLRSSRGITQSNLGEILGVTKASICCYEKGTRTPTIENLIDMVNYFDVSADYLLGIDNQTSSSKNKNKLKLTEEEIKFIEVLRNNKEYKEMIMYPDKISINIK